MEALDAQLIRLSARWRPFRAWTLDDFPPGEAPEPAGVRELVDCLVVPSATGLHDADGLPVPGSSLERGPKRAAEFPFGAPGAIDAKAALSGADEWPCAVFLPFPEFDAFGHLLTEGAGWLWPFLDSDRNPLDSLHPDTKVLLVDSSGGPGPVGRIAELLKCPAGRIRPTSSLDRPVFCRRVFLPVPSMVNRRWIAAHHFEAVRRIVDRAYGLSGEEGEAIRLAARDGAMKEKIYLSRSRLGPEFRLLHGEGRLEEELSRLGWRIVHPESLPIREQLLVLARARALAGEVGSAFHSLMYFGSGFDKKSIVMLGVPRPGRDPRVGNFLSQFRRQPVDFHYLDCLGFQKRAGAAIWDRRFLASPSRVAERIERLAVRSGENVDPAP